jgi:hypothetical protein
VLVYLQYQQIVNTNWIQGVSENAVTTLANAIMQIPGFNCSDHTAALSNLSIPLTGSLTGGFTIGFMRR